MTNNSRPTLGERLKEIRKRKGLSLSKLAELTGLARSTLYKVENSGMSLTYDRLLSLSEGLEVDIAELFASKSDDELNQQITARRETGKLSDGYVVNTPHYKQHYLCSDLIGKHLVPMYGRIKVRTLEEFGEMVSHAGEEFTIVLDGKIEVHTAFYKPVRLKKGEYIYLDSTMAHAYLSVGKGDAEILTVCSGPESMFPEKDSTKRPN